MIFGTHNSATYGNLVWWQKPLNWLNRLTSRCQDKTIHEQWECGVRYFDFQVTYYAGDWHISHGLFTYQARLLHILKGLSRLATPEDPVYFHVALDNNFIFAEDNERFEVLIALLESKYVSDSMVLHSTSKNGIPDTERYYSDRCFKRYFSCWSLTWAKHNAKTLLDWLPLPERFAGRHRDSDKSYFSTLPNTKDTVIIFDFYEK